MIRKTSETRALAGNIVNAYSTSQNSAYGCDYVNTQLNNINTDISSLETDKISQVKMSEGRYIKHIDLAYRNNAWCLKVICVIDGSERTMYINNDAFS